MSAANLRVLILICTALAGCGQQLVEFPNPSIPTAISTDPANASTGIAVNRLVHVTFSEAMDPATITSTTFTLAQGSTPVAGTVSYAGVTATFVPAADFAAGTLYTATISTGAESAANETGLAAAYQWTFTTAAVVGPRIPPVIVSTDPGNSSTGIATSTLVSATFSGAMAPATINGTTFTLKTGTTTVAGSVTYAGTTATFAPTAALLANSSYTALITTAATDLAGTALATNYSWSFTTAAVGAVVAPTVLSTNPGNGSTGVATNQQLTATFSVAMDSTTINGTTFTLAKGSTSITGVVTYAGAVGTFTPSTLLDIDTTYTATITTGAKNVAGVALAANYVWTFTTGVAPSLISTTPLDGAINVQLSSVSSGVFSEPMDATTLATPATTFTVKEFVSGNTVPGSVTYLGNTATFTPSDHFLPNTKYTSTISNAAQDLNGVALVNGLAPNPWSWTTGNAPDVIAPTIIATLPLDAAIDVAASAIVTATFSEAMDPSTMTTDTFTVKETLTNNSVLGSVSYDIQQNVATFTPLGDLTLGVQYTATISNGAMDIAGNPLVVPALNGLPVPNPWSFTTIAPVIPLALNLGSAATFGFASRAGITSTGVTVVNGDIALYPLGTCVDSTGNAGASQSCLFKTYSSPTGLTVNGSIYWAGDPFDNGGTADRVANDLNIAWIQGKNMVDTNGVIAADELGGHTFLPGVYHNANLGLKAGGICTLDAQNDANAIFFFKVDSTFVDSGTILLPSSIVLANGAQARNVWFVAGLDITIGSGTSWNGNILAGRTATINHNSVVMGRVLAGASGAGAITLTGAASPSLTSVTVPQ